MWQYRKRCIRYLCTVALLISCQNLQTTIEHTAETSLSSDNGQLDLSLSTLEQQNIEKEKAEKFLLEARQKRTIVEISQEDDLEHKVEINIAIYARETTNKVGKKIYRRLKIRKKQLNPCLRFVSSDDAQRFFLAKDGPQKDLWNLDPDGDGFACEWNPEQYRKITIN